MPGPYNPQRKPRKRKRDESTKPDDTSVTKSLSQLSMKENSKKKKKRPLSSLSVETHEQQQQQEHEMETEENIIQLNTNKQNTSLHHYLNATDKIFKQMLKSAFANNQNILQWCKSKENLQYLREHTRLLDRVYYLKLEQDLWENYIHYGDTYGCWTCPLSKIILRENQLEADYKMSKKSMENYQEKIKQQKQKAEEQVEKHALLLKDYQHQDSKVDEQQLWAAILALVRKGQQKLSKDYEHRKKYFENSAKDRHFVKTCYDCQPTKEEIMSMQIIWQATINECKSQENVDILKQHLYIKRIPKSLDYLDQSYVKIKNKLAMPIFNQNTRTTILTRHQKIIAQNKCDLITLQISLNEAAVRGYYQYGQDEKKKLISRMKQDPDRQTVVEQFIQAIEQRQKHIRQYKQYLTQRRIRFFYHRSDDRRPRWNRRGYRINQYWNILPSSPIIEAYSKLTSEQLALLARGPKYVPPCQSRFVKNEKREKLIKQEHENIMHTIKDFFRQNAYCVSDKRIEEFSTDLKNLLETLSTKKLSRKLRTRAKREHKLVVGVRRYLHQCRQVILRRTDKSKVFHLGDANDYQTKVLKYMQETEAYQEISSKPSPLSTNLQRVTSLLDRLYNTEKPLITKKQYEYMYPKENQCELAHLYFLPKPHKVCILSFCDRI